MTTVWELFPEGGSELLALLALADWADDEGRCFPSIAAIAKKTRLSKSQTQRVVHGLIEAGFVAVEGNESGGAPGATRRYRILMDRLTGSAHATGSADDTPTDRTSATGSAHATGRTDAADGSHPCGETGSTHATQTVIEPSGTTKFEKKPSASSAAKLPTCPTQALIDLYHEHLPDLPMVRLQTKDRVRALRKIWAWCLTSKRGDGSRRAETPEQALEWFREYFTRAGQNDFLMGRTPRSGEHANWRCDLDFLLTDRGMKHVIEKTLEPA